MTTGKELTPFTQGYVEALLADALPLFNVATPPKCTSLSPGAWSQVEADCSAWLEGLPSRYKTRQQGMAFWNKRQARHFKQDVFPVLTVRLGDDNKLEFAA